MSNHWDQYYGDGLPPQIPSQFCVFIANEFPDIANVVESGCGNGRDALYFAALNKNVVAFDGSAAAIESCQQRGRDNAMFFQGQVGDDSTWEQVGSSLGSAEGPVILYNRFFLHAIDDPTELKFLEHAARLLKERGGYFCLECRTVRDEDHVKVTPDHYRRFAQPLQLAGRLHDAGFKVEYFVEGYGMAKYRADDAYVVRIIAS